MRKFKKKLLLVVAAFVAITNAPLNFVSAEEVSHLTLSVIGDGYANISDEENNEYKVEKGKTFNADITVGSELNISMKANQDFVLGEVIVNGNKVQEVESKVDSTEYKYTMTSEKANIEVKFIPKEKEEEKIVIETKEDTSNITTEETKEEVKEDTSNSTVEETKLNNTDLPVNAKAELCGTAFHPTDEDLVILNDYEKGNQMKPEYVQARKEKAEYLGFIDYVDEDYFLKDKYYQKYSPNLVRYMGGWILYDPDYIYDAGSEIVQESDEVDSADIDLYSMSAPEVTYEKNLGQTRIDFSNGGYVWGETAYWHVDGNKAFCGHSIYAPPKKGDIHKPAKEVSNSKVKKILYYGYKGPKDKLTSKYGDKKAAMITNELVSEYMGNGSIASYAGNTNAKSLYENGYATFMKDSSLTVPSTFKAYVCESKKKGTSLATGQYVPRQPLVFWKTEKPKPTIKDGYIQINKTSAKPEITNSNNYYSLVGAEYKIYKSKSDASSNKNSYGTLKIGSNGWSNELKLKPGTYYVKETKAPKGYALDTTVHEVSIKSSTKTTPKYKDYPKSDPVSVLLQKVDKETGKPTPQGNASLADAQYTFKFYKGTYGDGVDPATQGKTYDRAWVMKTNPQGKIKLTEDFKVSGDDFYYTSLGVPSLPCGTLTVQETKAPKGYVIDNTVHVRKISPDSSDSEDVYSYNTPTSPEQVNSFRIKKYQANSNTVIPNVVFKHTKPSGATELTTDSNGEIVIKGLETGIHKIQEVSVQEGYTVNPNEFSFEVLTDGRIVSRTTGLDTKDMVYEVLGEGSARLNVYDKLENYDIKITKTNDHDKLLDGAEFTLYAERECKTVLDKQVSKNGELIFKELKDRTHYFIKETKAPQGYRIPVDENGNVHVYEVYTESTPSKGVFDFYVDGKKYTVNNTTGDVHLEGTAKDRVVAMKVVNTIGMKLPVTGSTGTIMLVGAGALIMSLALLKSRKSKKQENVK